jgi:hypothetical protein
VRVWLLAAALFYASSSSSTNGPGEYHHILRRLLRGLNELPLARPAAHGSVHAQPHLAGWFNTLSAVRFDPDPRLQISFFRINEIKVCR